MAWNEYEYRLVHPRRMIQGRSKAPDVTITGEDFGARLCRYDVRYGAIRYVTLRYYRTVGMYRYRTYIDQCKDTVREESGYHHYRYKLKERMPNITGIQVSFGSETEYSLASASNVFLNWPKSRCVENSIGRWIGPFSFWGGRSPAASRIVSVGG
jgi:hypothetical protein